MVFWCTALLNISSVQESRNFEPISALVIFCTPVVFTFAMEPSGGRSIMAQPKPGIELTRQGVFLTNAPGDIGRKKIAPPIRLRAIGKKADGTTMAQIRFRTMHGDYRSEFFTMSNLLPKNRGEIKNKLADLGYEWPEDGDLTSSDTPKSRDHPAKARIPHG
jgi:hypothetical protein